MGICTSDASMSPQSQTSATPPSPSLWEDMVLGIAIKEIDINNFGSSKAVEMNVRTTYVKGAIWPGEPAILHSFQTLSLTW